VSEYVVLLEENDVAALDEPFGPGYPVVFDQAVNTEGYAEIRIWVHVFAKNYEMTPITTDTRLIVRLMHQFPGGSFDYERQVIKSKVTSYINGYVAKPVIGDTVRILCAAKNMPAGPYKIHVTYYLV
jgi:hypothetical protein